jgi:peptidoglycan/xylan/chitin deacetylase (PgdA/CDA1 family)
VIHSLRVLNFHEIGTQSPASGPSTRYPAELFEALLRLLHRRGWRTIVLSDAIQSLQEGESLPPGTFALTFDDGYQSFYNNAFPLLIELGFTATIFVTTGDGVSRGETQLPSLHGLEMLSWRQLSEIHASGFEVGSHSMLHEDLRKLTDDQLQAQLKCSKEILENHLDSSVASFAYPYGRNDRRVRDATETCYRFGFADDLALIDRSSNVYALPRIDMAYFDRRALARLLPSVTLPAYLGLRRNYETLRCAHSRTMSPTRKAGTCKRNDGD